MSPLSVVYVLTNPAMPGLVKIGKTDGPEENRVSQLYNTSVPVPFTIEYACRVPNSTIVEKALHSAFAPQRINPKREFFKIDPEQAIAILKLVDQAEDVTTDEGVSGEEDLDQQSKQAAENLQRRRSNFSFKRLGIAIGSVLQAVHNDDTVEVVGDKKVRFRGEEMSFAAATQLSKDVDYAIRPLPYWTHDSTTILELYEEQFSGDE